MVRLVELVQLQPSASHSDASLASSDVLGTNTESTVNTEGRTPELLIFLIPYASVIFRLNIET